MSQATDYFEAQPYRPGTVTPRRANFDFPGSIEKHWLARSPIKTHFCNTLNLILPVVEIFMVRVLKRLAPEVQDSALAAQVRGFMTQESRHSAAHTLFFRNLREQGYRIDRFLGWTQRFFGRLDRILGPRLSISTVACAEHYTAMFSEIFLEHEILREADPRMRALFEWHAAEEIEHRTVAFDLFQAVDGRYGMRCLGAALATAMLIGLLTSGILMLTYQDGRLFTRKAARDTLELLFTRYRFVPRGLVLFAHYLRPGFHPSQREIDHLAARILNAPRPGQPSPLGS